MSDLPVSQRARDAAAPLFDGGEENRDAVRRGKADGHPIVQAFSAFERDCTAPYREALQKASDILEEYIGFLHRMPSDELEMHPYIPTVEDAYDSAHAALQHGDSNDG